LLHGKKNVFIDGAETRNESTEEVEAHDFAANLLVPASRMRGFLKKWRGTESEITEFAKELQITPAIVVGQLQHMNELSFGQMNHVKTYQFDLTDE
jgi:Zn-dependent peptidase ImmA (M78 family)